MPSQPGAKLLKHGGIANAQKHHMTLPNASEGVWCNMHARNQTKPQVVIRLANQMRKENVDVVDNSVKNDAWEMSMSEEAKQNAWAEHYERLLNGP